MNRIIFDLDNTLMMFDINYVRCYESVLEQFNYDSTPESAQNLYQSIGKYESLKKLYVKQDMIDFVNDDLKANYSITFFDYLLDSTGRYWTNPVEKDVIDTLEYLSKKYELYILTNWFSESQVKRLDQVGIRKYFSEIIGSDKVLPKPSKESFDFISRGTSKDKCIMIGDSLDIDYYGAINSGINAILYDYQNKYSNLNINRITKFKELKEML